MNQRFLITAPAIMAIVFISIAFVFLTSNASATILLSQTNEIYNLGDNINLESKISKSETFEGFLRIVLNCNNKEALMYFSPIALEKNKEKTIAVNFPVVMIGSCYINSILEDNKNKVVEEAKTENFVLSNKIDVKIEINKKEFKPEEILQITGTAMKANGKEADGIATIYFNGKEYAVSVSKGKFSFIQKFETNVEPGEKTITIRVKDDNNNSGEVNTNINIAAIPTNLIIETNNESFLPDTILMITPKLLDQANGILAATLNVKILKQTTMLKTETLLEELVKSGDSTMFRFTKFHRPGNYVIEASWQNFNEKKMVKVIEYEKIKVALENNILNIENIGNVPFKRKIEITFSIQDQEYKKIIELDLKIGETKSYKLEAPQGTYDIKINTGDEILTFSKIPLTGSVVATIDLEKEPMTESGFLIIMLIIIAALVVIFLVLKNITKYKTKKEMKSIKEKISKSTVPVTLASASSLIYKQGKLDRFSKQESKGDLEKYFIKHSEKLYANKVSSALVYGTKQEITALVLTFQGFEKLEELKKKDSALYAQILDEYFAAVVEKIKENQGVASIYGNELIVLFNIVKQYRHDIAAIRTAESIKQITSELNSLLAAKGFNINLAIKAGANIGMANVNAIQNKEVKYTSIGNTTFLAKALKERAIVNEILITETLYERVANAIKAKKISPYYFTANDAINIYSLESLSQQEFRDRSKWYINRALGKV
ncbi:MAG: hypothetical protein N3G19_00890 [Candidatus Pacearchaeota archaeon]|nr:hypothetical protein [Candidatus Pacearchaeota archaeon]